MEQSIQFDDFKASTKIVRRMKEMKTTTPLDSEVKQQNFLSESAISATLTE